MRYRLSGAARRDLGLIADTSVGRHGRAGRARYLAPLFDAFGHLAAFPATPGSSAIDDMMPGVRRLPLRVLVTLRQRHKVKAPPHVIFYRIEAGDMVHIMRVLHERMDVEERLKATDTGPAAADE